MAQKNLMIIALLIQGGCVVEPTLPDSEVRGMVYGNTLIYQWPDGSESRSYTSSDGKTYYYTGSASWKGVFDLQSMIKIAIGQPLRHFCYNYTQPHRLQHCGIFSLVNGKVVSTAVPNDEALKLAKSTHYKDVQKYQEHVSALLYPGYRANVSVVKGDSLGTVKIVNNDIKSSRPKKIMETLFSEEVGGSLALVYGAAVVAGVREAFKPVKLPEHCTEQDYYKSLNIIGKTGGLIPSTAKSYRVSVKGESCFHEEEKTGKRGFISSTPVSFSGLPQDTYEIEISAYDDVNNKVFSGREKYKYSGKENIECVFYVKDNYLQCR